MAKQKTKRSGNSRPQGRQNAFSGVKLEFLESYKDRFLASMDRGAFYTLVAKSFIEHFGYNLAIEENPGICDEDAPGENDPELQSPEELEQDVERQNSFYRELREVSEIIRCKTFNKPLNVFCLETWLLVSLSVYLQKHESVIYQQYH